MVNFSALTIHQSSLFPFITGRMYVLQLIIVVSIITSTVYIASLLSHGLIFPLLKPLVLATFLLNHSSMSSSSTIFMSALLYYEISLYKHIEEP